MRKDELAKELRERAKDARKMALAYEEQIEGHDINDVMYTILEVDIDNEEAVADMLDSIAEQVEALE